VLLIPASKPESHRRHSADLKGRYLMPSHYLDQDLTDVWLAPSK
jgi:hypothetical protein